MRGSALCSVLSQRGEGGFDSAGPTDLLQTNTEQSAGKEEEGKFNFNGNDGTDHLCTKTDLPPQSSWVSLCLVVCFVVHI